MASPVTEPPGFRVEAENRDHLQVWVFARSHPNRDDFWDGNWLDTRVTLSAGRFKGDFRAFLRGEELVRFRAAVGLLYTSLGTAIPSKVAEFATLEGQLSIRIVGDGLGHFTAACVALDEPGVGNRLTFTLTFDQTYLPALLRGLDVVIATFPVTGETKSVL